MGGQLKGPGGDCGGAQRDKDPGDLAGDLGRPLRSREGRGEEGADARAQRGRERPWALAGGEGRRGLGAGRRAVRGERVGELGRECLLGRARGRAGLIAGQAGMEPGRVRGGTGPAGLGWKKESEPWATSGFVGLTGLRWFWVCFLFLSQAQLFEFKRNFEFKPL